MLQRKTFDATLQVKNPINFSADKHGNALSLLRNTYEGKNLKGAHIVQVTDIVKISDCRIVSTNLSAEGVIDVVFAATVAVYALWDIIPDVAIVRVEQFVVGTTTPDKTANDKTAASVAATFVSGPATKTFQIGQIVPARVALVEHGYMRSAVMIVGTPLTCDKAAPVYLLKGSLSKEAANSLLPIVEAIGRELVDRDDLCRTRLKDVLFFETLLYSYAAKTGAAAKAGSEVSSKAYPVWRGPPIVGAQPNNAVNLLDFVKAATASARPVDGVWCRTLNLYRSSPLAIYSTSRRAADLGEPVEENTVVAFQTFLSSVLNFLFAVRILATKFNKQELINSHQNVWTIMRDAQIQ